LETQPKNQTQAYLLRAWREDASWRFRIRIVQTGEEYGFTALDSLQAFLRERFQNPSHKDQTEKE
jgi:hypothetical protein